MKNTIKFMLFFALIMIALITLPCISNAAETETATDESTLKSAIENVNDGGTVEIKNNITITGPIVIQKSLTIDGNGFTLSGSTDWTSTSGNQTMFTAQFAAGKLTLKDIDLNNGPKYGVQAYDGGTVILNNVSITGFRYGGVLANGGNVEVIDLHLGYNGTGANNGIEIDKGPSATNNPTLTMNGTLTSDSTENVVRPATNGNLTEFTVTNTENTTNKVVIAGDKVVLTDKNNTVISEAEVPDNVTSNTDEAKKIIVTIMVGKEPSKQITVDEGTKITAELIKSNIQVDEGYEVVGYYTDADYSNEFDFDTELNADIEIYARIGKIAQEPEEKPEEKPEETLPTPEKPESEKDDVPKTGVENYLGIAVLAMVASVSAFFYTKKMRV